MVTAVMKEKGVDVQEAINYIGERFDNVVKKFLEDMKDIPRSQRLLIHLLQTTFGGWVTGSRGFWNGRSRASAISATKVWK